ncbi:hypothetical protein KY284_021337 [Solanum tuberosum]|nr:hypothetical protein KY284_021337 [Solanum tuberosum]
MLSHINSSIVPPLPSKGRQGNIMAHHHRESQSPELRRKLFGSCFSSSFSKTVFNSSAYSNNLWVPTDAEVRKHGVTRSPFSSIIFAVDDPVAVAAYQLRSMRDFCWIRSFGKLLPILLPDIIGRSSSETRARNALFRFVPRLARTASFLRKEWSAGKLVLILDAVHWNPEAPPRTLPLFLSPIDQKPWLLLFCVSFVPKQTTKRLQNASTMQLLQSQRDAPWSDDQDIGGHYQTARPIEVPKVRSARCRCRGRTRLLLRLEDHWKRYRLNWRPGGSETSTGNLSPRHTILSRSALSTLFIVGLALAKVTGSGSHSLCDWNETVVAPGCKEAKVVGSGRSGGDHHGSSLLENPPESDQ